MPPGISSETDCACAEPLLSPAPPTSLMATAWRIAPEIYRAPLPDMHELVFASTGQAGLIILNQPARAILNAYRQPHTLTNDTARQLAPLGLLVTTYHPQSPVPNPQSTLTAWLHITNACNLNCDYCYVKKSSTAMTQEVGCAAIDAVIRSAQVNGYQAIKLKYAGGEPTLHPALVNRLHNYAVDRANHAKLKLRETLLSNGVAVTDELLAWLRDENMRVMISIDGLGQAHDKQRHFADGRGTASLVCNTIERALRLGLKPYLSITISADNAHGLSSTVAFALERGVPFNLNFVRAAGGITNSRKIIAGVRAAFEVIENNLPPYPLTGILDRANFAAPHPYTCGAGRDYLVIDPAGKVARCQMELEQAVTDVWADNPLLAVRAAPTGFQAVTVDEKENCRACLWRYACGGGCPLLTHQATGHNQAPSPYCEVYQALYPDLLRLEGLRLLKWGKQAA